MVLVEHVVVIIPYQTLSQKAQLTLFQNPLKKVKAKTLKAAITSRHFDWNCRQPCTLLKKNKKKLYHLPLVYFPSLRCLLSPCTLDVPNSNHLYIP